MKLKEFEFWAYKLELSESRDFSFLTRCVCAHFERYFESINTNGVYRVIVKLSDGDSRDGTSEISSSVLKFYKKFDFHTFNGLDDLSQKKLLLNTLYESLIEISDSYGWPKAGFKKAYDLVIQDQFVNIYVIKSKLNSKKSLIAKLVGQHSSDSFCLFVSVSDTVGNEIYNKLLLSEKPDEIYFNGLIGDIKWVSNEVLVHLAKDKTELERFQFNAVIQ